MPDFILAEIPDRAAILENIRRLTHPDSGLPEFRAGLAMRKMLDVIDTLADQLQCLRQTDGYQRTFGPMPENAMDTFTVGEWMDTRLAKCSMALRLMTERQTQPNS